MPDLLLELFSEEIPARMQARAAEDLRKAVTDRLVAAGVGFEGGQGFLAPRGPAPVGGGGAARGRAGERDRRLPQRRWTEIDQRRQGAARQEGRFLRRGDREARPRRDRRHRRNPARRDQELSVAEVDA